MFSNGPTRPASAWPRLVSRCSLLLVLLGAMVVLPAFVPCVAQTDDETDVHVIPRTKQVVAPERVSDPSLLTHTKPLSTTVNLVLVPVTIVDSNNRPVLGLDKDNFQIYENKQLQAIQHFSSEDTPVSLGVIFDMSGSMDRKIDRSRQAVAEFLKSANPEDEFFLIAFADRPQELADFTTSIEEVEERLMFAVPKGRTSLIDAIYLGVNKMRNAKYAKRALLVISDGGDNHSRYSESQLKNLVKEADVMIYAIGIYDRTAPTEEERLGPELLSDISGLTGGRAFTIDDPDDCAGVAAQIGVELRNQYVIGYRPQNPPHDGKWHKIRVKLTLLPKQMQSVHTYAKKGYYALSE
jgi:Ca-activated chloride channel homolog